MTKMLLKFVHEFKDRHGKTRRYFRRPGFERSPLPGLPGSEEFMQAYQQALAPKRRLEIGGGKVQVGTVNDLVTRYFKSAEFLSLAKNTQRAYRGVLERFRAEHGDKRISKLEREHVKAMVAAKVETPTAANALLKMLRLIMPLAIDAKMRTDDPTIGVKRVRVTSEGHIEWSEQDIAAFRNRHAPGTRARLAMELALGTMQRRGDLVRLGRQHVQGGLLSIRQEKTRTQVEIPVLAELQAELGRLPADQLTFLLNEHGKAFRPSTFTDWFRKVCDEAGLPEKRSVHGLRKSGAIRLAEAGCTDHEIMAWGGWTSLSEVQRYTKKAKRRKLAQGAVLKLEARTTTDNPK